MDAPKISIVMSTARSKDWAALYRSCKGSKLDFEIIAVGVGGTVLPGTNFTYIPSLVKPAQCYEIAFRQAKGELVLLCADDVEFVANALDIAYDYWKSVCSEKDIVAMKCIENGKELTEVHRFLDRDIATPLMAPFFLMNRLFYKQLGGYDKRFICGQSENDIVMRVYSAGGKVSICRDAVINVDHINKHKERSLFRTRVPVGSKSTTGFYTHDRSVLLSLWMKDGKLSSTRLSELQPFQDDGKLLKITQGPKGIW